MSYKKIETSNVTILPMLLMLFVLCFQFQWQGMYHNSSLRLSITDLILPVLSIFLLVNIPKNRFFSLNKMPFLLWFSVFSLWFGISLYLGYIETGVFSEWAVINKFIGWFTLIFYFYIGYLIKVYYPEFIDRMLKALFLSCGLMNLICILLYIPFRMNFAIPFGINANGRFVGFLINPNTYGLFYAFIVLLQIPFLIRKVLMSYPMHYALIFTNIAAVLFSGSRSAIATLIIGILGFSINRDFFKRKSMLAVLLGLVVLMSFIDFQKARFYMLDEGARTRIETATLALDWWKDRPFTGIGLGSFLHKQEQQHISPVIAIHNTPLWLLTETGIIGLLLCGWFTLKSTKEIYDNQKNNNQDLLSKALLIILPVFIIASFTTEIFYQRYLWFFLGLVLVNHEFKGKLAKDQGV